jgi:hypothetical protein
MVKEVVSRSRAYLRTARNSVPAGSSPDRMRSAISMPISRYRATIDDLVSLRGAVTACLSGAL